jgi:hypothetical protein
MAEDRLRVCGSVHPATSDGFRALLTEANLREKDGYEIVTVVRLDKGIASLFRLRRDQSVAPFRSFFGDD